MAKCKELAAGIGLIVITTITWLVTSCSQPVTSSISMTPLTVTKSTPAEPATTTTTATESAAVSNAIPAAPA
jgi:hypothetical protein